MKRAALIAGVSVVTLLCAGPSEVSAAWNSDSWWGNSTAVEPIEPPPRRSFKPRPKPAEGKSKRNESKNDKTPPIPSGLLHIIVSIDKQRATLFADGAPFASTAVSSGTASHPTPMGVFTVIQKSRHHVSNLYDAPMPYMQRITWSGAALHEGPLPGYPASHGCVRLTTSFAQLLWKATKMGARVIVTRPEVAPLEFDHARLFVPRPKMVEAPKLAGPSRMASADPEPATTATVAKVKTANSASATAVAVTSLVGDASKPVVTSVETAPAANTPAGEQPTKRALTEGIGGTPETTAAVEPVETKAAEVQPVGKPAVPAPIIVDERPKTMPAAIVQEANGRPISVFASLKEGKLYVRQGWKPLFEAPVRFEHPDQPVGTHVYTAMGMKADGKGLRWTVVSIPSSTKRVAELKDQGRKSRTDHAPKAVETETLPSASVALDRIVMPPELVERISELMMPGSSLIVSDNKLSDETGEYTDFIVLTR
jgi:hypothetical protein